METTQTPESDAAAYEDPTPGYAVVSYDFARKMERERDEALAALSGRTVSCERCNEMAKQLTEKDAQIVALREALEANMKAWRALVNSGDAGNWNPEEDAHIILGEKALSAPPPAVVPLEYIHSLLDGSPAQIIRNAKDGYPEGREDRVLSIEERIAALKQFASDHKRWLEELEELTGRKHP